MPHTDPKRFSVSALEIYARPGFAERAIALQDDFGFDVNCLLFCLWAGIVAGKRLTVAECAATIALTGDWSRQVAGNLREARRALKEGMDGGIWRPRPELYEAIKAVELSAEKIELEWLDRFGSDWPDGGPGDRDVAVANLHRHAEAAGAEIDAMLMARFAELVDSANP